MILEDLVHRFPQLYVAPSDTADEAYRKAALKGIPPTDAALAHFTGTEEDFLRTCDTPAGPVDALFLKRRDDFERVLQCLAYRCKPKEIPPTTGAMCIDGLADWSKIHAEHERATEAGMPWGEAFAAFTANPANYRVMLVVISEGPYSAVDASRTPYDQVEWASVSRQIRLYHELAHVVCRRLMPGDALAVYDELTADFCGLVHATGTYDPNLAAIIIGVDEQRYIGGRLENYLMGSDRDINEVARKAYTAIQAMAEVAHEVTPESAYAYTLDLKRRRLLGY